MNASEELLIAGNVCSVLQLWDTSTGQLTGVLRSSEGQDINVISSIATHPSLNSVFVTGTRDGKVSLWDVRCPQSLYWRFLAHEGKLSSLQYNESGLNLLSSGRDGVIRLWDARQLPANELVLSNYVQEYHGHVTFGHWVPAHYLNFEKFILSGSETNKAFIYETLTGKLVKVLTLGSCKVIFTAPVPDSVSFYYVNYSTQTIGLCDVEGEEVKPQEQTPMQIRQNFMKEKMQEVMLDCADQIIAQLNKMGALERTGLHQIVEALSRSEDPEARGLLAFLMSKYEERLQSSQGELADRIMSSTTLPNSIFQRELQAAMDEKMTVEPEKQASNSELAPTVVIEASFGKFMPNLVVQQSEGEDQDEMEVEQECAGCPYCQQRR